VWRNAHVFRETPWQSSEVSVVARRVGARARAALFSAQARSRARLKQMQRAPQRVREMEVDRPPAEVICSEHGRSVSARLRSSARQRVCRLRGCAPE